MLMEVMVEFSLIALQSMDQPSLVKEHCSQLKVRIVVLTRRTCVSFVTKGSVKSHEIIESAVTMRFVESRCMRESKNGALICFMRWR